MDAPAATQRPSFSEVKSAYRERHRKYSHEAGILEKRCSRVENLRGVTFATLVVGGGFYLTQMNALGGIIAAASLVAFVWLVRHHGRLIEKQAQKQRFSIVNEQALARLTENWHGLPRTGVNFASKDHPYSDDLDLFGVGSVYQRISVAHTRYGQQTLANWLQFPADEQEIIERQKAVAEIAPLLDFRQRLEAEGMALVEKSRGRIGQVTDGPNPRRLLAWVSTPGKIAPNLPVVVLSWLLPIATLAGIHAQIWMDAPPFYWIGSLVLSVILLSATKGPTSDAFAAVSTTEGAFLRYGALLHTLEGLEVRTPWLKERHERLLAKDGVKPSEVMRRFRNLVSWYDLRHNGMVYPFVNALLLWDLHCTRALENWKKDAGADLHRWFEVIGDVEAISSLAALHADDPGSTLPVVFDSKREPELGLMAENLGHPLLGATSRVTNDVAEVRPGQALLVTGSNMSGKSTFLRALGVNVVLAFAGGPVIANALRLPLCRLGTSIRVSDSLKSGVSHFYAEVQKLALVVEASRKQAAPVLFLLDEVLHGTNSRERQIGARWVLAELLEQGAFGVITTHDMELCRLPDALMTRVRQHHFRENVKDGEMTFDYKLREGPVTSGNALRLMQKVGLDVPLAD